MNDLVHSVLVALAGLAVSQEASIVTAGNDAVPARDLTAALRDGKLVFEYLDSAGARRGIAAEDVVEIAVGMSRSAEALLPAPDDLEVTLTSGDLLVGKAGTRSPEGVQILSRVYGNPTVEFEAIRSIFVPANRAFLPRRLPGRTDADLILKTSGDRADGTLLSVSDSGVVYKSSRLDKEVAVPLQEVVGVWLVELKRPPEEPKTPFSSILTQDGSSLRGRIQSLAQGVLTFQDLYGKTHRIAADEVSGIFMKNGRVVYLSDLDPVRVEEDANYIRGIEKTPSDLEYPFQRDRSAKGTRMMLGGAEHRKGLGVRAHSDLTFALGGAYRRVQATLGLDAVSLGLGSVAGQVWVDGRKVQEIVLRGDDPPHPIDVDVAGAGELRLVVTWAGHGQSDFADWGSARLIR